MGIERFCLVPPNDCKTLDVCLVLVWEILEANRYENPVIFSGNLGGHRPPRRIKVYNGKNIHELKSTTMSFCAALYIYIVEAYG